MAWHLSFLNSLFPLSEKGFLISLGKCNKEGRVFFGNLKGNILLHRDARFLLAYQKEVSGL
jgi:hypothetical protein